MDAQRIVTVAAIAAQCAAATTGTHALDTITVDDTTARSAADTAGRLASISKLDQIRTIITLTGKDTAK